LGHGRKLGRDLNEALADPPAGRLLVGIDVGGTFTDVVVYDPNRGACSVLKARTSENPVREVVQALLLARASAKEVALLCHATTLLTNALLTRTGLAETALITNDGFRDILEIGRQRRPELYNPLTQRPEPLVPRRNRFTVPGRIAADGSVLEELDAKRAREVASEVIRRGFQAVAICFLHSYANPIHEHMMRDLLQSLGYGGHVSASSDVVREYREYERMSTAVVNAALSPVFLGYLTRLERDLRAAGMAAPIYIMNSEGGVSTLRFAKERPVCAIESGPAAGVIASRQLARSLGLRRALTFDMGGTTAKAGTLLDGEPELAYEYEAAGRTHSGRSIKGSGYVVRWPFIDLAEVSAGGGTVAWVDEGGALRVGPRSAGAEPGPACYGRGGREPTVTDANVVLGRLNPQYLLGGEMRIFANLAYRAIEEKIARPLSMNVEEAAEGIIRLINSQMAKAISIVTKERGRDPRDFTMIAFGGAGPMHCCDLADEMGIREILVPNHAGLFSAFGLLSTDLTRTFVQPVLSTSLSLDPYLYDLRAKAEASLREEGFADFHRYSYFWYVDMRYKGQSHELRLPYQPGTDLRHAFDKRHQELYGYASSDEVEVVNLRLKVVIPLEGIRGPVRVRRAPGGLKGQGVRRARFLGEWREVSVLSREDLEPGEEGSGPCILEEYDSTIVVNPGWAWRSERYGIRLRRD
jgi:N-methylhydantoinase A